VSAAECRTPNGFRTDFIATAIEEEEFSSLRHRSLTAEARRPDLRRVPDKSHMVGFHSQVRVYRLNRGDRDATSATRWSGFDCHLGRQQIGAFTYLEGQVKSDDCQLRGFVDAPVSNPIAGIWLAAPKTTDSLFLSPCAVRSGLQTTALGGPPANVRVTAVYAAALSAAFLFVNRAALDLDVDPEEFDVLEPRALMSAGRVAPLLQISDRLVNGAGYCERLASTDASDRVMAAELISSILSDDLAYPQREFCRNKHLAACDQSCYLCLQRYGNRAYHGLLDWRLGMAFLRTLSESNYSCGLDGNFDGYAELRDWPSLAARYAEDLVERYGKARGAVQRLGVLSAFSLDTSSGRWALVTHPLWDSNASELAATYAQLGSDTRTANTFDLARRPVYVREVLRRSWGF
jgi:DEAD/DEAH box helicase domain-containing protein